MTDDRVEWHLWNWARQHLLSYEAGEGFPSGANGGMIENYLSEGDSDRQFDAMCKHWGWVTESVINDLEVVTGTPIFKQAIHAQLLKGPWPHGDVARAMHYRAAVPLVQRALMRRGIE